LIRKEPEVTLLADHEEGLRIDPPRDLAHLLRIQQLLDPDQLIVNLEDIDKL